MTTGLRNRSALRITALLCAALAGAGCATVGQAPGGPPEPAGTPGGGLETMPAAEARALRANLDAAVRELDATREDRDSVREHYEARIRDMESNIKLLEAENRSALNEVLRLRARIGSLVAGPEASAMFAEARVVIDRMVGDAYNQAARDRLALARSYLEDGKRNMDEGNPGGAAFLFERLRATYRDFREASPATLTVLPRSVSLRAAPSPTADKIATLARGDVVEGVGMKDVWYRVRTAAGREGWLRKDSVH